MAPKSPLEMLQGCHARIRHFVQLSRTLAHAEGVPAEEVSQAAMAVFRYFSEALPQHEADEDQSLAPHFHRALPENDLVLEAVETMFDQHRVIDEIIAELLLLCASLGRHPERLQSMAQRLDQVTEALSTIFLTHMHLEESVIFPAIEGRLTPEQIAEISSEMQQRRKPRALAIHLVK